MNDNRSRSMKGDKWMYVVKLIMWILTAFCWWKIFEKAEIKGWKAFVPFYADYTRFGMADRKWVYFPFLILSFVEGIVSLIYTSLKAMDFADSILDGVSLELDLQIWFWSSLILTVVVLGIQVMVGILIARKFGKEPLFGIGLGILPIVFAPILAFDRSVYRKTI